MKLIYYILIFLMFFGCNNKLYYNCESKNLQKSNHINNTEFKNNQRTVYTEFSKEVFNKITNENGEYYKDILATHFYCNICFNSDKNYLVTYNNKIVKIGDFYDPILFVKKVIHKLSNMELGAKEYNNYINKKL